VTPERNRWVVLQMVRVRMLLLGMLRMRVHGHWMWLLLLLLLRILVHGVGCESSDVSCLCGRIVRIVTAGPLHGELVDGLLAGSSCALALREWLVAETRGSGEGAACQAQAIGRRE
jgi:hypothetical protein